MIRILSIDPGYDRLGLAVLEKKDGYDTLVFSTCIQTDKKAPMSKRLFTIGDGVRRAIIEHSPTHLALEKLFFNKNIKTGIVVAEVRGIIRYLAEVHALELHEYGPQEIKVAMTGYGKSDKTAVIDMVKRLVVNTPQKALDDEYDAIAVGVTCLAHVRIC